MERPEIEAYGDDATCYYSLEREELEDFTNDLESYCDQQDQENQHLKKQLEEAVELMRNWLLMYKFRMHEDHISVIKDFLSKQDGE